MRFFLIPLVHLSLLAIAAVAAVPPGLLPISCRSSLTPPLFPNLLMASKCIYCGSSNHGGGCPHSGNGKHESDADGRECVFCGSSNYGGGCPYSPTGKHRHGHGKGCVHCGSSNHGGGCPYNPGGKHVH